MILQQLKIVGARVFWIAIWLSLSSTHELHEHRTFMVKRDLDSKSDTFLNYMLLERFNVYRRNVKMRIVLSLAMNVT